MLNCLHCQFPLIGTSSVKPLTIDSVEKVVKCSHCDAILRIQVTTLKDPDKNKLKVTNAPKGAFTYCSKCQEVIPLGKEHRCSGVTKHDSEVNG